MLYLYDTLRGDLTRLVPTPDRVTVYVCGMTPYATTHQTMLQREHTVRLSEDLCFSPL